MLAGDLGSTISQLNCVSWARVSLTDKLTGALGMQGLIKQASPSQARVQ